MFAAVNRSRAEFCRWFPWAVESAEEDAAQNLRAAEEAMAVGTGVHHAILTHAEKLIGRISVEDISNSSRSGMLGYWLDVHWHGRGLMTEAGRAFLTHVFQNVGLHRVWAAADTENAASNRVLVKLGFRQEGTRRHVEHHPQRGWCDEHLYALLEDEWPPS